MKSRKKVEKESSKQDRLESLSGKPPESERSRTGNELLSATIGFVIGVAGTAVSTLIAQLPTEYSPGLIAAMMLCSVVAVSYSSRILSFLGKRHLAVLIVGLLITTTLFFVPTVLENRKLKWRASESEALIVTLMRRIEGMQGVQDLLEPTIASQYDYSTYYEIPSSWSKSYFSSWQRGKRFRVTCIMPQIDEGSMTRSIASEGSRTFNYGPEDLAIVRLWLYLDKGSWEYVTDISVVHSNQGWQINDTNGLHDLYQSILADMEAPKIIEVLKGFHDSLRKDDTVIPPQLDASSRSRLLAYLRYPTITDDLRPANSVSRAIDSLLSGFAVPTGSKCRPSLWALPRGEQWICMTSGGSFVLRDRSCGDVGLLAGFVRTEVDDQWKLILPTVSPGPIR